MLHACTHNFICMFRRLSSVADGQTVFSFVFLLQPTPGEPAVGADAASSLDPLGGDPLEQEKLAAIARSLEEKYVSSYYIM